MKFVVTRTSEYFSKTAPCEGAKRETIVISNGRACDEWTIELNSLDDMIAFYNEYGKIIIQPYILDTSYKEIEIYDTWRE